MGVLVETEFEMVSRHVREGIKHIEGQRRRVENAVASGDVRLVEATTRMLSLFEESQLLHLEHLERLARPPEADA